LPKKFPPYEMFLTSITCTNFEPSCNCPMESACQCSSNKQVSIWGEEGGGGWLSIELLWSRHIVCNCDHSSLMERDRYYWVQLWSQQFITAQWKEHHVWFFSPLESACNKSPCEWVRGLSIKLLGSPHIVCNCDQSSQKERNRYIVCNGDHNGKKPISCTIMITAAYWKKGNSK
jgi:hypothetical protein